MNTRLGSRRPGGARRAKRLAIEAAIGGVLTVGAAAGLAAEHGGELELEAARPHGLEVTATLPLGGPRGGPLQGASGRASGDRVEVRPGGRLESPHDHSDAPGRATTT